jgi:hypothetical protein
MNGSIVEALIVMAAAAGSLAVFAVIGRRTMAAIPRGSGASEASRP